MGTESGRNALVDGMKEVPALRANNEPDDLDDKRALWSWERFTAQDGAYRLRDRTIEENIRFLAGQHWWVYHHLLGWKDITYWMSDEEKRWRQRPVFNRILPWFILTHARMTENPFICTYLPGPDRRDAELAEMLDILHKKKWRDMKMTDVWDRCAGWLIAAGAVFPQTRIDLNKGEWQKWIGTAELPLIGPDDMPIINERTGEPITQKVGDVPFDENGEPCSVFERPVLSPFLILAKSLFHDELQRILIAHTHPVPLILHLRCAASLQDGFNRINFFHGFTFARSSGLSIVIVYPQHLGHPERRHCAESTLCVAPHSMHQTRPR